jgi:hypothetical protein
VTVAWALILFAPVGVVLMWKYTTWRNRVRWGWTVFFAVVWAFAIASNTIARDNKAPPSVDAPHATKTTKPTQTPKPTNTPKGLSKTVTAVAAIDAKTVRAAATVTVTTSTGTPTVVLDPSTASSSGDGDAGEVGVGTPVGPDASAGVKCGSERWPVKTLSDQDAGNVNFTPQPISVSALRGIPAPAFKPQSARVAPVESTTYWLVAKVLEFKLEDDMDVHVVISDTGDPAQTMIVEFPDASKCTGAIGSAEAAQMKAARAALVAAYGPPPSGSFEHLTGTASFVGVGFFDFKHGQTGVAPNAVELHPVIGFSTLVDAPPPPPPAEPPPVAPPPEPAPAEPPAAPQPTMAPPAGANWDPSYPDVCLADGIGDWDCAGGGGNGPNYIKGPIRVLAPDPFKLDSNHDGVAC